MKTVLLSDLGPELPIGNCSEGSNTLVKTFEVRPYKAKVDRALNIWREANQGRHIGWLIAKYLSLVVVNAGGQYLALDDKNDSSPESVNTVTGWHFADVVYMYLWSRYKTSSKMKLEYGCPNSECSVKTATKIIDLGSIEVVCLENFEESRFWVKLVDGFRLQNNKLCKRLKLKPVPFRTVFLAGATQGNVDDMLGYNQLREAVIEVEGGGQNYNLLDEELDEMSKVDSLLLNQQAGKISAGPKLRTGFLCDGCKQPIERAIDLRFDHFFESSIPVAHLMS